MSACDYSMGLNGCVSVFVFEFDSIHEFVSFSLAECMCLCVSLSSRTVSVDVRVPDC